MGKWHLVTVSNQKGMSIEVLDYGATLVSVNVPIRTDTRRTWLRL